MIHSKLLNPEGKFKKLITDNMQRPMTSPQITTRVLNSSNYLIKLYLQKFLIYATGPTYYICKSFMHLLKRLSAHIFGRQIYTLNRFEGYI